MASNRIGRINEEIQRELSTLIRNIKDPRVTGMVSITAVDTTADLRYAKIFISVLDRSDVKQVLKGLKSAGGYLRRELGHTITLRYTPELIFEQDDSIDKGAHILEVLRGLDRAPSSKEDANDEP
jgi:ribosome-binding factor A